MIDGWVHGSIFIGSALQRLTMIFNGVEQLKRNEVLPPLHEKLNELLISKSTENSHLDSLPPSLQKQIMQSKMAMSVEDDDDIDGVPLFDVEWQKKEKKVEKPQNSGFKKSTWESVDTRNEDSVVSTKWGDQNIIQKKKRKCL